MSTFGKDPVGVTTIFLSWTFTSLNPAMIPQILSCALSIFGIVNYIINWRKKNKL